MIGFNGATETNGMSLEKSDPGPSAWTARLSTGCSLWTFVVGKQKIRTEEAQVEGPGLWGGPNVRST